MNKTMLASMREQMCPGEAAQAALLTRLAAEPAARRGKSWRSLALAACAALILCAYPMYQALKPQPPALHSYVQADASDPIVKAEYHQTTIAQGVDKGGEEEGPNTGDLPGGAYVGDAPSQPGADAYQLLMDHFGETLPDWFGGAYLDGSGALMVLLVEGQDPGDKSLELKVLDVVGALPVGFTSAKYSRNDLMRMNDELLDLLDGKGLPATWGIYDDQNRIILDVSEPLSDDLLAAIAKIDPGDDAILIRVIGESAVVTPDLVKGPPPAEPIGAPAAPGGVTEPQEKAPAGVQDLPAEKNAPAEYDLLPLE